MVIGGNDDGDALSQNLHLVGGKLNNLLVCDRYLDVRFDYLALITVSTID